MFPFAYALSVCSRSFLLLLFDVVCSFLCIAYSFRICRRVRSFFLSFFPSSELSPLFVRMWGETCPRAHLPKLVPSLYSTEGKSPPFCLPPQQFKQFIFIKILSTITTTEPLAVHRFVIDFDDTKQRHPSFYSTIYRDSPVTPARPLPLVWSFVWSSTTDHRRQTTDYRLHTTW